MLSGIRQLIYMNYYLSENYNVSFITNVISLSLSEDSLSLGLYDKLFKSIQYNFYFKATYSEDYTLILDNNNKIIY